MGISISKNTKHISLQHYVQYQNECRLRIADVLLKVSTLSISEIAGAVGFQDEAYFSRTYKKSRGLSPMDAKSKLSK